MRTYLCIAVTCLALIAPDGATSAPSSRPAAGMTTSPGAMDKITTYMMAGDYRRALMECQRFLEADPSVEGYLSLTYIYQAIDAYLTALDQAEQWTAVEQLYLNLAYQDAQDLIDPPGGLARMAKEVIQISVRQQGDLAAAMAMRLDRDESARLWTQQTQWRADHPHDWWLGLPDAWRAVSDAGQPGVGKAP